MLETYMALDSSTRLTKKHEDTNTWLNACLHEQTSTQSNKSLYLYPTQDTHPDLMWLIQAGNKRVLALLQVTSLI
jgi:hypothetical protein